MPLFGSQDLFGVVSRVDDGVAPNGGDVGNGWEIAHRGLNHFESPRTLLPLDPP